MVTDQLNLLVNLALIDNHLDPREVEMILRVGKANGLDKVQIQRIIDNPSRDISLTNLTEEQKIEYLVNMVQLMKIDGKTFNGEILYCQEIATRLGFEPEVISSLYTVIFSDPKIKVHDSLIRTAIIAHLKENPES